MTDFRPSCFSDGYGAAEAAAEEWSMTDYLTPELVEAGRQLVAGIDPREQAAIIRAKIENKQASLQSMPFLSLWLKPEINKLKAQLAVVEGRASTAELTSAANTITQVAGTFLVIGGVVAVSVFTWSQLQAGKIRKEELKRLQATDFQAA